MSDQEGQATVEWVGLVLLVALVMAALLASGTRVPGSAIAGAILERLACAVSLGERCRSAPSLEEAYGEGVAAAVRDHAPALAYEQGAEWIPSDFRRCTERECASSSGEDRIVESRTGATPTAFTRAIDCRGHARPPGSARGATAGAEPPASRDAADCSGHREGNLYIAYWFYYPESDTFEGVPVLEEKGYHRHDWESYQVRIGPRGEVDARASSHRGHNHRRNVVNWASDAGVGPVTDAAEELGARPDGGWGEPTGWLSVTAGSHAGNIGDRPVGDVARLHAEDLLLVPLEPVVEAGPEPADFSPVAPPWDKALWTDPEARHTG